MGYGQRHSAAVASRLVSWAERAPVEAPSGCAPRTKTHIQAIRKEKSMMHRLRRSQIHKMSGQQNEWPTDVLIANRGSKSRSSQLTTLSLPKTRIRRPLRCEHLLGKWLRSLTTQVRNPTRSSEARGRPPSPNTRNPFAREGQP